MRTIFLMRHAKSSWDDAALADFDRPLNGRGERAAPFMGLWMQRQGFRPEVIVSSPARRARQTAEAVKEAAGFWAKIVLRTEIYEASPVTLAAVASQIDERYSSAMMVGHNPGMEGFVRYLTRETEPMPTAAVAVIDLEIDAWTDITDSCAELRGVFLPKDLMRP